VDVTEDTFLLTNQNAESVNNNDPNCNRRHAAKHWSALNAHICSDDVTTCSDDVTTDSDDVTTDSDDVTSYADVTTPYDDITTHINDDVTTRNNDILTHTDDITMSMLRLLAIELGMHHQETTKYW